MSRPGSSGLPKPLTLFLILLATLALISLADAIPGLTHAGRQGLFFLWVPHPGFDFYDYTPRFPFLHTRAFFTSASAFPWVYPAPAIFVLYPFYLFATPTHWVPAFLAFCCLTIASDLWVAWRFQAVLVRYGLTRTQAGLLVGTVLILGWPIYFALQRGNIESMLWVGIALGIYSLAQGRDLAGALLIGIFGSAKLYPLLFLALFLRRGQLRSLLAGLAAAGTVTLAGLWCLEPDVRDAWRQIGTGVQRWTTITTLGYGPGGVGPDHSLLGLLRECTAGAILRPRYALGLYLALAGAVCAGTFLLRVRKLPAPNQVLFIACAAILLPPTSYDYTLVLVLIPWAWIVLLCVEQAREGGDLRPFYAPLLLLAVALAPLTFLYIHRDAGLYFAGPVRAIALLGLMAVAAIRPFSGQRSTHFS